MTMCGTGASRHRLSLRGDVPPEESCHEPPAPPLQTRPPDTDPSPAPRAFPQGRAHVADAGETERKAAKDAAADPGKPAPEGGTPGGISS